MLATSERDRILEFLAKKAPQMALADALWLANEFQRVFSEGMFDAECLAVLAEPIMQFNPNGGWPDEYRQLRPGVRFALNQATYRHGWVACGPVADGIERLTAEFDVRAGRP